jgi:hypothetical protein
LTESPRTAILQKTANNFTTVRSSCHIMKYFEMLAPSGGEDLRQFFCLSSSEELWVTINGYGFGGLLFLLSPEFKVPLLNHKKPAVILG